MPAGVGRGQICRNRNLDTDHVGTLSKLLRPLSLSVHKADAGRPQRSARKVRRDAVGRPTGRTSGSEHVEVASKQHPGRKPVADDMDTDSDRFKR
ncbi:hypothetical protein MRX96_037953 [Rhipicephalus microplus]